MFGEFPGEGWIARHLAGDPWNETDLSVDWILIPACLRVEGCRFSPSIPLCNRPSGPGGLVSARAANPSYVREDSVMSILFRNFSEALRSRRPARRRSLSVAVEGLDQRALLSAGLSNTMATASAEVFRQHDIEKGGVVIQKPAFYEDYVGPKLAQFDAVAASGQLLRNGNFHFAGLNLGVIKRSVTATYVFGVDRSGNLPTGPFPGRPDIRFDALVAVKLVPHQAPTVTVMDKVTNTNTIVQHPDLVISGKSIAVTISGNLLPSTGLAPSHYRYAYWPEDGLAGSTNIASFAPTFHDIQVG